MQTNFNLPSVLPGTLQDLPPKWAHLCLNILNFVRHQLQVDLQNQSLLLAVSGGVDSLSMLLIFKALQQKLNLKLEVAHLDHGLRPGSQREAQWVAAVSRQLGLPCHVRQVSLSGSRHSLEEKGRQARYAFFSELLEQQNLHYLALAHNQNDLAEDQLLRLLRGCGWPELGGMPGYDPKRRLLRPLLLQPRCKLEALLRELGVGHMEDESNASDKYTRNRVRHHLIPLLEQENSGYLEHSKTLWRLAWADQAFWNDYLPDFRPDFRDAEVSISLELAARQGEAVSLRIYRQCLLHLAEINGRKPFFTPAAQLFEINKAVKRRKCGQGSGIMRIQFPGGAEVSVENKEIVFRWKSAAGKHSP